MRPGAPPKPSRYARLPGGAFIGHRPPWDPGDPLLWNIKYIYIIWVAREVWRLFRRYAHNTVTHSSFTQPVLHHLLSFLPFPYHFHICLVIMGRSLHVGLSGPLVIIICIICIVILLLSVVICVTCMMIVTIFILCSITIFLLTTF